MEDGILPPGKDGRKFNDRQNAPFVPAASKPAQNLKTKETQNVT
jgi:hypothetical protein